MTETKTMRVVDIIQEYGNCLELVPMDPHFEDITVGLYYRADVDTATVWTFSRKSGVEDRIRQIRDQLVKLGGMAPIDGTHNQVRFRCGHMHRRPVKFLLVQAVEKPPDFAFEGEELSVKDLKSRLMMYAEAWDVEDRWVYEISPEVGAPEKIANMRTRAMVGGLMRYGDMERVSNKGAAFVCGFKHDGLVRLLLPYARNVSAVEQMLESSALRGQLTTGTAGFSPL